MQTEIALEPKLNRKLLLSKDHYAIQTVISIIEKRAHRTNQEANGFGEQFSWLRDSKWPDNYWKRGVFMIKVANIEKLIFVF